MTLRDGLIAVIVLFPVSELGLVVFRRANAEVADVHDAGSFRVLWVVITAGIVAAIAGGAAGVLPLPFAPGLRDLLALGSILFGMAIRWASILTLGRLFTVNVAIHAEHRLVESGPYRFVRHPSYTGLILAFLGVGISFGDALSIAAILVPTTLAVWNRILKEEGALRRAFGDSYDAYAARTKRLIPGVL